MPNGDISQAPRWKALYNVAIEESNTTKLPRLLDNAIDAVLSRIEDVLTRPRGELIELNLALARPQLRRKELTCRDRGQAKGRGRANAA